MENLANGERTKWRALIGRPSALPLKSGHLTKKQLVVEKNF